MHRFFSYGKHECYHNVKSMNHRDNTMNFQVIHAIGKMDNFTNTVSNLDRLGPWHIFFSVLGI